MLKELTIRRETMESIHKLEKTVADWYKNVPHLPKGGQKWIAENVWWIILIAVILGVFSVFSLFAGLTALTAVSGVYGSYSVAYGANVGMALTAAWVSIISLAITTVIMAMAISPLKAHKKKGWDLIFVSDLIYFVIAIIGAVITFNFGSIIGAVIGTAIGFYFLFEIRSYFLEGKAKTVEPAKKADEKTEAKTEDKK